MNYKNKIEIYLKTNQRQWFQATNESKDIIKRKPFPISTCEESMLSVVVFDSTQTQGSSKYFLFIIKEKRI